MRSGVQATGERYQVRGGTCSGGISPSSPYGRARQHTPAASQQKLADVREWIKSQHPMFASPDRFLPGGIERHDFDSLIP